MFTIEQLRERHDLLATERARHVEHASAQIAQIKAAAEREDAAYAGALGELERMIAMCMAQAAQDTPQDATGDTESGAGVKVHNLAHDDVSQLLTSPGASGDEKTDDRPVKVYDRDRFSGRFA